MAQGHGESMISLWLVGTDRMCIRSNSETIKTHKSIKTSGLLPVHRKDREDRWLNFVWPFANVVWSRIRSAVTCFTRAQEEPKRHPKTVGKVSICWLLFSKTASENYLWYIFKWNKIFFEISVGQKLILPIRILDWIMKSVLWLLFFYSTSQDQENTVRQSSCWWFWFWLQERGFQSHGRPTTRLPGHWFFSRVSQHLHFWDIYASTFIPVSHILHLCSAVTWTPPSRNGHVIRCVHGWRTLAWVSTCKWPDSGWLAVRLYFLPPRRTWRR